MRDTQLSRINSLQRSFYAVRSEDLTLFDYVVFLLSPFSAIINCERMFANLVKKLKLSSIEIVRSEDLTARRCETLNFPGLIHYIGLATKV